VDLVNGSRQQIQDRCKEKLHSHKAAAYGGLAYHLA
jgi:hypothetical protein